MTLLSAIEENRPFYSLEFFPPKEIEQINKFLATVNKLKIINPLFVSVTYGAGGGTKAHTLNVTRQLQDTGLKPMAHLTCVGSSRQDIKLFLSQLKEHGVTNVLALRGDPPHGEKIDWSREAFQYASDLVLFIKETFPEFEVAVTAYPTPHPQSVSFASDRYYTKQKLELSQGFAITQLFFDNREYFEFVDQMRKLACTRPIIPGILPIPSFESIRRILSLSGGNIPAKLYLSLEEAQLKGGGAAVKEAGISFAAEQIKQLLEGGAPGVHLYTLNQAETCLRVIEAVETARHK